MKHSDARTLARNLALDRDGAVSGTPAGADVATILNDHITRLGANDRSKVLVAASSGFSIRPGGFSARLTSTNIMRVLAVTSETGPEGAAGSPLEIVLPSDVYHMRGKSATPGTPSMVAFTRLGSDSNRLRAIVHPPAVSPGNVPEFISWTDNRAATAQVYVQKIVGSAVAWTTDGVQVSASTAGGAATASFSGHYGTDDGGCVVLYRENIGGVISVMAQRFSTLGARVWTSSGVVIASATSPTTGTNSYKVMSDGGTGFLFGWYDERTGERRTYVQRVDSAGAAQWTANGVLAIGDPGNSGAFFSGVYHDGSGGLYVMERDGSSGVRLQHINSAGSLLWGATGILMALSATGITSRQAHPNADVRPDGSLVMGYTTTSENVCHVRNFNSATGATVWTTANLLSGETMPTGASIDVTALTDNTVIVTYVASSGGVIRVKSSKISAAGALVLGPTIIYTSPGGVTGNVYTAGVRDSDDNSFISVVTTDPLNSGVDWVKIKLSSNVAGGWTTIVNKSYFHTPDSYGGILCSYYDSATAKIMVVRLSADGVAGTPFAVCSLAGSLLSVGPLIRGSTPWEFPPQGILAPFALHCYLNPPELTTSVIDDNEVIDATQTRQYEIVREAALDLAIILRRPDSVYDAIAARAGPSNELAENLMARDMATGAPRDEPK